ncbi:unnamed protein product [Adineta steineri]|uniref:TRPM-like domain-containing protein n=1 Tax=Adineta steineri TaxID=433720 RepID=A0A814N1B2_9BILA|nr:unnamed protein product [Adineta steineri]CAF1175232.1 unnamed protein product [Adineta steineri]
MDTGSFASKLARNISRGSRRKIPLVTILVGADLHALKLICTDLESNIPVLIIDSLLNRSLCIIDMFKPTENQNQELIKRDSTNVNRKDGIDTHILRQRFGRTTLKEVFNKFGSMRSEIFKDMRELYDITRQKEYTILGKKLRVGELLNSAEEKVFAEYLYWFATCLASSFRDRIHVFDMNPSSPLQDKIYEAMVKARKNLSHTNNKQAMTTDDQMLRSLRWKNISDDTDGHLTISAVKWKDTKSIKYKRDLILNGMSENAVVLVSNFVKLGIDFAALFAPNADSKKEYMDGSWKLYLEKLYSEKMRKNIDPLYLLEKTDNNFTFNEETRLTHVLRKLVGDFMEPIYKPESSFAGNQVAPETPNKIDSEYIFRDLFLWCVLTHRLDIAKIFLNQMKTRICSALIASKILKSLLKYAPDHDLRDKLNLEADDFEMYAIECVRSSYLYDREQACELIMRRVNLYGEVTCLRMAIAADDKRFLNEDACNALLTNIWFDKIDPTQERTRLIINLLTMGIAQFGFSNYEKRQSKIAKSETKAINKSTAEQRLAKNGIDYSDDYNTTDSPYTHFKHFHNRPIVNTTITKVQDRAQYIWAYDRCGLVRDYYGRPALFPPFTFLISFAELCRWCWQMIPADADLDKSRSEFERYPTDVSLDKSWSEFERYSTNDYVRQCLDTQTVTTSNIITTDVTSEISSTNSNELKHLASDIHELNDGLTHARNKNDVELESIKSTVSNLQSQVYTGNARLERIIDSLDWMMSAIARVKMASTHPPVIKENPRTSVSNQGQQLPLNNAQDNLRLRKPDSGSRTQQAKQEGTTASDVVIDMTDESNNEQNV